MSVAHISTPASRLIHGFLGSALLLFPLAGRAATADPKSDFRTIDSLDALRRHLDSDGARVRLAPGVYIINDASSSDFLDFRGNGAHFDLSGVTLKVETSLSQKFGKVGTNMIKLSGSGTILEGFSLETIGQHPPSVNCRAVSITGSRNTLRNVSLTLSGSYPYGYGSFLGIGSNQPLITPLKLNGIRVAGDDNIVAQCRVIMRCFGHGIFLRGANRALIKDCQVEGVLRRTDEILAETSGPAFAHGFRQYTGEPIPAGEMTSLSEDGIRAYPDDPDTGRRTQNIQVENCRVLRMRRAICLAFAAGINAISDCEVIESERVGFHIGSRTVIRRSRADALYAQVLDISSSDSRDADAEVVVLDSRRHYGNTLLAKINGTGHRVKLTEAEAGAVPVSLQIEVASTRGFGEGRKDDPRASGLTLINQTPAAALLLPASSSVSGQSFGPVTDRGLQNSLSGPPSKRAAIEQRPALAGYNHVMAPDPAD